MEKLTYTITETAQLLGLSRGLCYQLAREGRIPVIRLGERRLVVPKVALMRILNGNGHKAEG